jgi:hypothetical protein
VTRAVWTVIFLPLAAVLVGLELLAALDGRPETVPLTDYVVTYVPWEVTTALIGALILWLPAHLGIRYVRKRRTERR